MTALDTETGAERWRFIAEGPVRFAPLAWDGKVCRVFDPTAGKQTGRIALPDDGQSAWFNLRASDDHLVGSRDRHVLCVDRRTGKLQWRFEAGCAQLYLAVGGGKVFCAELPAMKDGTC